MNHLKINLTPLSSTFMKIKTKKFATTPKGVDALESFLDSLGSRLISDEWSSDNKIIVKYYG